MIAGINYDEPDDAMALALTEQTIRITWRAKRMVRKRTLA